MPTTRGFRRPPRRWIILLLLLVIAGVAAVTYVKFYRRQPPPYFASSEEHFLFGSIGTEAQQGIPYWVWLVLPRVFPEYLPAAGGYASLGIVSQPAHEMPVGFSKVTIGYPRVGMNCAMCHTATIRPEAGAPQTIVPAAPAHQAGAQQYLRFLFACASDPRFTASTLLREISKNYEMSALDRALYRLVIIPQTRRSILRMRDRLAWMEQRPQAGRGRIDAVNVAKFGILEQPVDRTTGTADMMPLWSLNSRAPRAYGWDGSNSSLQDVVVSSALAEGSTREWVDDDFDRWNSTQPEQMASLRRVQNYISGLQAPKYPFAVDRTLAATGAPIFTRTCASCHANGAARTGTVIPVAEIDTDRERLDAWTPRAAGAYNAYGDRHDWKMAGFKKTNGYVAAPLDGIWVRAPYLHNGSVPSLADLLEAPASRPTRFWRGYDVYDQTRAGFVTTGPDAERRGTLFEVARPGNGNGGHVYGTDLSAEDKRALIEYLKTM
jgi:mono/diheme cytochrome c family protein